MSQLTAGRKNNLRYEIAGTQDSIWFDGERPNELWIGHRNKPNEHLFKDPGLMDPLVKRYIDYPGGHNEGYPDSFKMCFRSFYDYIAAGDYGATPFFPTFAEGHHEILLCEAILRSHDENRWVNVGDVSVGTKAE